MVRGVCTGDDVELVLERSTVDTDANPHMPHVLVRGNIFVDVRCSEAALSRTAWTFNLSLLANSNRARRDDAKGVQQFVVVLT